MTKTYFFDGGLINHPRKGYECFVKWEFDTDSNYVMVGFTEKWDKEEYNFEICHKDNLKEKDE